MIAGAGPSMLPTTAPNLTAQGTILGTLQYMAPEQLEGHESDARSDIFAFGAVGYEMVTGRKAFTGKSHASLVSAIMSSEPAAMASEQPLTPPTLDHIVRRCLAKDPQERWQSMSDVMRELTWVAESIPNPFAPGLPTPGAAPGGRRERLAWIAAAALAVTIIVLGGLAYTRGSVDERVQKFSILPPPGVTVNRDYLAVSPDGRSVAFVASSAEGRSLLWIRSLGDLSARALPSTEDARHPFWSPDSRFIGFFAERQMKKIQAAGGQAQRICDAPYGFGGTWNREGIILFAPDDSTVLYRVSANGGTPSPVTKLAAERSENGHSSPTFLPDGRHFLYVATGGSQRGINMSQLNSATSRHVIDSDSVALYAPPKLSKRSRGHLIYVRNRVLLAQPFDADRGEIVGDAVPIGDGTVQVAPIGAGAPISVTDAGVLAYRAFSANTELAWFDRLGRRVGTLGHSEPFNSIEMSPDGTRLAVERDDLRTRVTNIWIVNVADGLQTQFTFNGGNHPKWSSDGRFISFVRSNILFRKQTDGTGAEERLWYEAPAGIRLVALSDWSPDGRVLVIRLVPPGGASRGSLWFLPVAAGATATLIAQTEASGFNGRFSPDGRWLAYTSDESGIMDVYLQPVPTNGAKFRVSRDGGIRPRWRHDGKELFYVGTGNVNGGGKLVAVSVEPTATARISTGTPIALMDAAFVPNNANNYPYAVSVDGQRILLIQRTDDQTGSAITVVLDWTTELAKKN